MLPAGLAAQVHDALGHTVHPLQRRLDLAELHAVAADLDLVIGAAMEGQGPVRTPRDHVPGAVHALADAVEGVSCEPRRGQPRA